jgi:hypothetical protein
MEVMLWLLAGGPSALSLVFVGTCFGRALLGLSGMSAFWPRAQKAVKGGRWRRLSLLLHRCQAIP